MKRSLPPFDVLRLPLGLVVTGLALMIPQPFTAALSAIGLVIAISGVLLFVVAFVGK